MSRVAASPRVHRESLLRIPLLAQALGDRNFRIVRRGVDARWKYDEAIGARVDGFNPLYGAAFIARHSRLDRWLPHRHHSARPYNEGDGLVEEALYLVHDYLHVWAYQWIDRLAPQLGFGTRPITRRNIEDMAFCHILSEAVATVGLDYWYLSVVELPAEVPIGKLQRGLTVSYREELLPEYRRFNPAFEVQTPAFFGALARFYCDGIFPGFSIADMKRSPVLDAWLTHEVRYGQLQRRYCRQWFAYLAVDTLELTDTQLEAPLRCTAPWQKRLIAELGERLWAKVKRGEPCPSDHGFDPARIWTASPSRPADPRFINLNRCGRLDVKAAKALPEPAFAFLMDQYMARFDFAAFPPEVFGVFELMRRERDPAAADRLLKGVKRIAVTAGEPRDLFLYN